MRRTSRQLLAAAFVFASSLAAAGSLPVQRVADDVYVIPGVLADASSANRGRVVNTGFIVGRDGVIVVDSGANHGHGEAILATVASVTGKPVALLINSHPHPQNVLGNSAFAARGIPILATAATAAAMRARCPDCLRSLERSVGAEVMAATRIQLPDRVAASEVREVAGRRLTLLHAGHGHTEGDLVLFDAASGVLFAGDLVYRGQVPHLSESDTAGWLASLQPLRELPVRTLVPGRGPVGTAADLAPIGRYLLQLRQRVAAAYRDGRSADEAIALADLPEFSSWQGYAERHGRNVQHVYFEIERDDLNGGGARR
ncbi:MAG: MBL fold metallo-hydrolase [Rhodocyclales bacterium]|nr:MBL fold metallo-hydrolase [Rhodocyclales bacterium]